MKRTSRSHARQFRLDNRWFLIGLIGCLMIGALALSLFSPRRVTAAAPETGSIAPTGPVAPFTGNWTGTATGSGANATEADCIEDVNCDTFRLTVLPGVWSGKTINARLSWTVPANDYDIYIHKCPTAGSTNDQCNATPTVGESHGGAPGTEENSGIDPNNTGTGDYTLRIVHSTAVPAGDAPQGSVTVVQADAPRTANYISGGITFTPNVTVRAPVASRDGEPSIRTDVLGNTYVGGIRGVPAGVDLWFFDLRPTTPSSPNPNYDPYMRNALYRGQPDSFTCDDPDPVACVGSDGGGDIELAVGFPDPVSGALTNPPTLSLTSLVAANVSAARSTDRGVTFTPNPLGNVTGGVPGDDRQWQEFHGQNNVYLLYRTLAPAVTQIQRSTDGGLTFGPAQTAGAIGQVGYIDVHQKTGRVYISGSTGQVCHSTITLPTGEAAVYQCVQAASDPGGVDHLFFPVKVADDGTPNGTVYVPYSNGKDIFLVHSTDHGVTWSKPVRVSNGNEAKLNLFPWMETGPTPGSVGIVWYGTDSTTNDDNSNWQVFFAQSFNATAAEPTFQQTKVSDHIIHSSNISEGGLCVAPVMECKNRNLIDYFQISFDPAGAAVVAYTDDHNDFDGHTYVARQASGPAISGGKEFIQHPGTPPPSTNGPQPSAASVGGIAGSQVTDFAQDAASGRGLVRITTNDPFDVLSVKYSCEVGPAGELVIAATMKVSDLAAVPAGANWRMNFTANAPFGGISPVGDYSFALSDRGDQFYLRASTETNPLGTFTYGTATRGSDGTITYVERGAADCGAFDTAAQTITVKVAASKLNSLVTKGPAIGSGSTLAGLRGSTFAASSDGRRDITRGGTEFTIGGCTSFSTLSCATPASTPTPTPTPSPTPSPTSTFQFSSAVYAATESVSETIITVTRVGTTTSAATVDYTSVDGTAKQKGDYTFVTGKLNFATGETQKTFGFLVNEDNYTEGTESATLILSNPSGGTTLGVPNTATVQIADDASELSANPIDDPRVFAGTHYHDFLARQADQSGEDFWTNETALCNGEPGCLDAKRVNVSAAFFLSIEFQTTGYLIIRTHKASFGSEKSNPRYTVFLRDQRAINEGVIVGQAGWEARLEQNTQRFFQEFVQRVEFVSRFPHGTPAATYVDTLFANAGATPTAAERNAALAAYGAGDNAGRAAALRSIAQSNSIFQKLYNPSFVLMQYYGYLRRNPDDAPDNNFSGYDFWLAKLEQFSQPNEDVRDEVVAFRRVQRAEMVRAFLLSTEYRQRFGGSPTGNQQGRAVRGVATLQEGGSLKELFWTGLRRLISVAT